MTYQELIDQLEEIKREHCPTTAEDWQRAIDSGYNDVCGCSICSLTRDLLIAECQGRVPVTDIPKKAPVKGRPPFNPEIDAILARYGMDGPEYAMLASDLADFADRLMPPQRVTEGVR